MSENVSEFPPLLPTSADPEPEASTSTDVLEACAEAVVEQSVGRLIILSDLISDFF